jgi:thiamine kinase-like enzyme
MQKAVSSFKLLSTKFFETISTLEGCEKAAERAKSWDMSKMFNVYMAATEPMRCGLKVLNHGDGFLNNMMFKNAGDEKTAEVNFIDFQLSFWGSPAYDLIVFIVSSVADDVKVKHFDDIIAVYHDKLESSLRDLEYDQNIPTLNELHIDLLEKGAICE